jgi:hypothetical protein
MIPITGKEIYAKLMNSNAWVQHFLPNAHPAAVISDRSKLSAFFELPLRRKLGDRFERWEMNRKVARFSKQAGFGEETIFSAEMCQGNFDHHKHWTETAFQERLCNYKVEHFPLDEEIASASFALLATPPALGGAMTGK